MRQLSVVLALVLVSAVALAAPQEGGGAGEGGGAAPEKPTASEVKKVFAYFNQGKGGGPIMLELTPCLKVGRKEGVRKKTCVDPVTGPVPAKTTVFAFTRFFVPMDDTYDVSFEWEFEGAVKSSKTAAVSTGYAYGTWKGSTLRKPGEYTIRIKNGDEVLGTAKVSVAAP